ncbi:MAG: lysine--tRNA ligase [Candidatus Paceibacterota bacterium]
MFWADTIVEDFIQERKKTIDTKESVVIRDEKTPSGRVHVGSMRGVAVHGALSRVLSEKGVKNTYLYEINDFDAFDAIPDYLDAKKYTPFLGKPLYIIPAPEGDESYAQYFGNEFARIIEASGFTPEFYYSSEVYKAGRYNEAIITALEKASLIRKIYKETSGAVKTEDWFPLMVVCEKCSGVAVTRVTSFEGGGEDITVQYICDQEASGAVGCGHEGKISPFNGNAKLPWKVEWGAKFKIFEVDLEGEGKDHATKGGARDVANRISQEVFGYVPPFDVPYEFLLIGDRKMSSSKGTGASARDVASLVPPQIFQLALLGKNIKRAINFDPEGDTIPILYDQYDALAEKYATGVADDETRLFELIHTQGDIPSRFLPRFSQVVFLVQMPHIDIEEEVIRIKGSSLTNEDKKELSERVTYARQWIERCAPERYVFELQTGSVPLGCKGYSDIQKSALGRVLEAIKKMKKLDGQELHTTLHEIRKEMEIEPKEFFSALYIAFLGKESGPKIGWFLSVLDRDFLETRLEEVSI